MRPSGRLRGLSGELVRFGAVGALAYVVDAGLFNVFAFGLTHGVRPVWAKVLSVTISTVVTWLGNRYVVFPNRRGRRAGREALLFFAFSAAGLAIAVGAVWVSHDVLGFTSVAADNVAGNVVGFGLASLFRFVTYRSVVFRGAEPAALVADAASLDDRPQP